MEKIIKKIISRIKDAGYKWAKYTPNVSCSHYHCESFNVITCTGKGYMYTIIIHEIEIDDKTFPGFEAYVTKGRAHHCYHSNSPMPAVHPEEIAFCLIPRMGLEDMTKTFIRKNGKYSVTRAMKFLIEQFEDAPNAIKDAM